MSIMKVVDTCIPETWGVIVSASTSDEVSFAPSSIHTYGSIQKSEASRRKLFNLMMRAEGIVLVANKCAPWKYLVLVVYVLLVF